MAEWPPTKKGMRVIERMLGVDKVSEQAMRWSRRRRVSTRAEQDVVCYVFSWIGRRMMADGWPERGVCLPPRFMQPYHDAEVTLLSDPLPSEFPPPPDDSNSSDPTGL